MPLADQTVASMGLPLVNTTITTRRVSFEVALFGFRAKGSTHPLPVPQGTGLQFSWILGLKGRHTFLMCRPFRACLSVGLCTVAYQPRLGICRPFRPNQRNFKTR